jgi:hypothetical protein
VGEETTTALFEPVTEFPVGHTLVLAHGAGTDMSHANMGRLADLLRRIGLNVVRFNFLYKEKGKGGPDRMPKLMACYSAVIDRVRKELPTGPLFIGGHSMGGRVASMLGADGVDVDGLLFLGYPLHPSGKPEKLRDAHLSDIRQPVLCLNGTRDPLCTRELMEQVVRRLSDTFTMHWLEAADHSYKVLKRSGRTYDDVLEEIGTVAQKWVSGHVQA